MGCCCSSSSEDDSSDLTVTVEQRRQQMLEAAEKRLKEEETRGLKNPESVRAKQMRESAVDEAFNFNGPKEQGLLRWQVD